MAALFVVSDVHGFRDDLVGGLRNAGLLDEDEHWSGGDAQLWILGDLVDRGPDGLGAVDLVMALQREAPGNVHMLMGNHEALALGRHRFPRTRFAETWCINGGRDRDQAGLTEEHVRWLASLPLLGRAGPFLLMHSDTTEYLSWGSSVDEINRKAHDDLAASEFEKDWNLFAKLTSRYHFARAAGAKVAGEMLEALGGQCIVHGHSIIGTLLGIPSAQIEGPIMYADKQVVAIDGGRYDGGQLLVVQLQ